MKLGVSLYKIVNEFFYTILRLLRNILTINLK